MKQSRIETLEGMLVEVRDVRHRIAGDAISEVGAIIVLSDVLAELLEALLRDERRAAAMLDAADQRYRVLTAKAEAAEEGR